ncbi:hypothetical protein A9179_06260 [Pseudomonas alcaligenes]|uniref:DUF805 domain-containing protein n=1 Tax=Aquipseudomonas alcaligenes TaxID=43263 RepID=A0ABR7RX19_AQUAC|nr:hypothetical protein [Pseudomonas alcaligenes]MBC9249876.1 hypothetical protein [Pseudomonas alcaligenes]
MIRAYRNIANAALCGTLLSFAAITYLGQGSLNGNVWGPGGAPHALMYLTSLSVLLMFWAYAKSKGRSGWLGVLLPFLSIIGLLILLLLKDKSQVSPEADEPV